MTELERWNADFRAREIALNLALGRNPSLSLEEVMEDARKFLEFLTSKTEPPA